ncbi:MAG: helix-turn-helix domain-containing protein [Candidatus Woesearchaeota archaeon]
MVISIKLGSKRLKEIESSLKDTFRVVKDELDDHRESINQNTNEIQGNYEYLCKLDSKIGKLAERIDELSMFIRQLQGQQKKKFVVSQLTRKEQEVFLVIYMNEGITIKDIGRRLGLTEEIAVCYVNNLTTKGVPLIKKRIGTMTEVFALDEDFKALQTKENIVGINETVSQSILN